jgi:hypothetical protein
MKSSGGGQASGRRGLGNNPFLTSLLPRLQADPSARLRGRVGDDCEQRIANRGLARA